MSAVHELELELESEFESELESEASGENELASELELELESNPELGFNESEHEQQGEHEAFFNHLAAAADRRGRPQALRRIALAAARQALRGAAAKPWPVVEGELEGESELGELEAGEFELLAESSPSPLSASHCAGMMEHTGHAAAEAANEQEAAEHFLPLIALAAKAVLPKLAGIAAKKLGGKLAGKVGSQLLRRVAPRLIRKVAPRLTRGVANVARTLFRNRSTRPLIHALPRIARSTVTQLGRRIANRQRITPQVAAQTLARQTARILGNPRALAQAYRRSRALDRRFHQQTRRVIGRPVGPIYRALGIPGASPGVGVATAGPATSGGCQCNAARIPTCSTCGR